MIAPDKKAVGKPTEVAAPVSMETLSPEDGPTQTKRQQELVVFRALVIADMKRLSMDGIYAPTMIDWTARRNATLPDAAGVCAKLKMSWMILIQEAGLERAPRKGTGADIDRVLAESATTTGLQAAGAQPGTLGTINPALINPDDGAEFALRGEPVRTETFVVKRADGATVRATREYIAIM